MKWFLLLVMFYGNGTNSTTIGPFDTKKECLRVEKEVNSHYRFENGMSSTIKSFETDCVSGAR